MSERARDFEIEPSAKCYSDLGFKNDPGEFQFMVLPDAAGGARPGVFSQALAMANLLQPEFILHVGDLIEGYSDDEEQIRAWWQEIDEQLEQLEMPFFFLPGNHDYYNDAAISVWGERFGDERGYYYFIYKDVLFLMINTEDPPVSLTDMERNDPEVFQHVMQTMKDLCEREAKGLLTAEDAQMVDEMSEIASDIAISDAHVDYFAHVLESHPDTRWTVCVTHSPPYYSPLSEQKDPGNFAKIEELLADRPYTVFSGHTHLYKLQQREGHDFITTATVGGVSFERPGAMDHLTWVTMTHDGPKIANLLMNGIMGKEGPPDDEPLVRTALYAPDAVPNPT